MKNQRALYLMILPTAALFLVFHYLPMAGLVLAFRNYDIVGGLFGYSWAGLKYFRQFFRDPYCWRIIRNTVLLNGYMLAYAFPAPIILALMLNEVRQARIKRLVQSVSYIPHFISTVVIVGLMMELLSARGVLNQVIAAAGAKKILFFQEPGWFRALFISSSIWESVGWNSIIYMAALSGINPEYYEYASIEGAGRFAKIRYVSLPGILPTMAILFVLALGNLMTVSFEKVFLMYSPGTYETADVISTYVYRSGIIGLNYSFATAVGLFNSAVNFALLLTANQLARRVGYGLW